MFKADKNVIYKYIVEDLSLDTGSVSSAIELFLEGATVPFIARYRKERTGGLTETHLRAVQDKMLYYAELEKRKETVLDTISLQGKLTEELSTKIVSCRERHALEDLYLPYKPKKQTKAGSALEKGLGPLAAILLEQKPLSGKKEDVLSRFVNVDQGVNSCQEALSGALDIVIESINDNAEIRGWIRELVAGTGLIVTGPFDEWKGKKSKYEMYYNFREYIKDSPSHRLLAIRRGANEKVISWRIETDKERAVSYIASRVVRDPAFMFADELRGAVRKAYIRISVSVEFEVFEMRMQEAEEEAIRVFSKNLENLLLDPPAGHKVIAGVDPGFVSGCKVAVTDDCGKFLACETIYPHPPQSSRREAAGTLLELLLKYNVELVAVGNGTASRETMVFISDTLKMHAQEKIKLVSVSESGASVYSASEVAIREFPDLDVTVRGAISIARRLQDPLSELVKIDPKAIGVGQYQHDVNQLKLKRSLDAAVESCVNYVGVELNTASKELLSYVAGVGPAAAEKIVRYRDANGPFMTRQDLLKITSLGEKTFEQCAGFLRIRTSPNRLDNSAIHPESYHIVEKMAADLGADIDRLIGSKDLISKISPQKYITAETGLPTIEDIKLELFKPGLDPRKEFVNVEFRADIKDIEDLKRDMKLFGKVTNVTNFGAFVDVGVHHDGLIHISNLSRKFVDDPHDVVSVGDRVRVKVISVDTELNRIDLERIS